MCFFVLSISPEICPNQHFLGVTNLRYVLLKADYRAFVLFLRISHVLFKVREPVKALHLICDDPRMPLFLFSGERDWVARWAGAKRMETFINGNGVIYFLFIWQP
jgi:hypothetical protein